MRSRYPLTAALLLLALLPPDGALARHHHGSDSGKTPKPHAAPRVKPSTPRVDDVLVWVDLDTSVFYLPGDSLWGRTLSGEYMSESAALAAGYQDQAGRGQ